MPKSGCFISIHAARLGISLVWILSMSLPITVKRPTVARVAGIQAAKRTSDMIPLCHPLMIGSVQVNFAIGDRYIDVEAEVDTYDRTGVEMEALTAVSVACLTIYDMCKAVDRGMLIDNLRLLEKSGGKSGHWVAG